MSTFPGFRDVPETGVIYVTKKAMEKGFFYGNEEWANLGQGSPEVGDIPGAPERVSELKIDPSHHRYSSVSGDRELRQAVADYYNKLFRVDKSSQYTFENVSIAGGGRIALSRLAAALGNVNMGHFLPDYTAYEELLGIFKAFVPIPILLSQDSSYQISSKSLADEVLGRGLRALLVSNPCNPTGQLLSNVELKSWVGLSRDLDFSIIFDEFYSHYIYQEPGKMISAASMVEDVNKDPIVVVNGLTKNWRYPGWRLSWTLGPKAVIEKVASAGSFLDGGANHPFQRRCAELLRNQDSIQEVKALQEHFLRKRNFVLKRLKDLNIDVKHPPNGGFYVWADLSKLPSPLNDGMSFFQQGLDEKVITVPGVFFDVNPSGRRPFRRYQSYVRFSFGPELYVLERGLDAVERLIEKAASKARS